MSEISISQAWFRKTISLESTNIELSHYLFKFSAVGLTLYKEGKELFTTDGRLDVGFSDGKKFDIEREYSGISHDRVVDEHGEALFTIERNADIEGKPWSLESSLIVDVKTQAELIVDFEKWRMFCPLRVKAYFNDDFPLEDALLMSAIVWLRHECEGHDQNY